MKRFWNEYKRAMLILEQFCRMRPMMCRQLTLIESEDHDTIILPAISEITTGARLSTKATSDEIKVFRAEVRKIEKFVDKISKARYSEDT